MSFKYDDFMGVVEGKVKFKKKDGSDREMRFTTDYRNIPEDKWPKRVTVFDFDKEDYRTINLDSVKEMNR